MLIHVSVVVIPLILFFAGVFAASEASLLSLSRSQLESLRSARPNLYRRIRALVYQPDALLATFVIGNEFLNILIGTLVAEFLQSHFHSSRYEILILGSVLLSSSLTLLFSEVLPKIIAFRMPALVASVAVYPIGAAHWLLTPIRKIFLKMSGKIISVLGIHPAPPSAVNEKDFLTLVEVGAESGSLEKEEKELIFNVFTFSDLTVSSVMTPWSKVSCVLDSLSPEQVLAAIKNKTFSRIPVLSEENSRVIGILYIKELLKLLLNPGSMRERHVLRKAVFPPYVVSTHKKISKLFGEFKFKKVHMALVVDEFGRHIGIVTLEDVLNALFRIQRKSERSAV
ncbi:MAG: DUF21 domain-containing protein [Deltaproteobacteria bacterium]|nr:DUF21 domain-containing protein [Deltaproteobacteria bacterium]